MENGLVTLDYAASENAVEIDNGIRDTIKGIRISILAMGLGLANMKAKGLYKNLGCRSLTQYIQRLSDETKMDRSNIFSWLRIGEAYIKYKSELEKIDFSDNDGPTKLSYLNRALTKNEKQEVFDNIKNMSLRDFKTFAKGQTVIGNAADSPAWDKWIVNIRGNNIYINGKLAIIISSKIERRASAYFKKVIRTACEGLEEEGVILPVLLRDRKEARRFQAAVYRLKEKMGLS